MTSQRLAPALTTAAALILSGFAVTLPVASQERPPGHPPITLTRPDEEEAPPASPTPNPDIDYTKVENVVRAMYDSISGPAGADRDWDTYRSVFLPQAKLITSRPAPQASGAGSHAMQLGIDDFVKMESTYLAKAGYFEKPVSMQINEFGNIAQVLCVYETRRAEDEAQPYSRGVNTLQLVKDGPRWWIVTLAWDVESPKNAVPEAFLNSYHVQATPVPMGGGQGLPDPDGG